MLAHVHPEDVTEAFDECKEKTKNSYKFPLDLSADTGNGFDPKSPEFCSSAGFDLFNTQDRITHLGGRMEIESAPGRGTRVILTVPKGQTPQEASGTSEVVQCMTGRMPPVSTPNVEIYVSCLWATAR